MVAVEHLYSYPAASEMRTDTGGQVLALASESAQADAAAPQFLRARALYPDIIAGSLRAVSEIVGSRFYVPPAMLARILREADPVATVSPGAVRFEGFSACCSTYIRLDMEDAALDVHQRRIGTTNVDFGPELRGALAMVNRDAKLDIGIGPEAVRVVHDGSGIVERKVPLPLRWIKGFAEVQGAMRDMTPAFRLSRIAAQRLLRALPRGRSDHLQWVSVSGGSARLAARDIPGAVPLRGGHRLRVMEPLVYRANGLDVFLNRETKATAWVLDFGAQRLCQVLNAEPWRGFSGDGGLLSRLATSDAGATAAVRAQLNWQSRIDIGAVGSATGLAEDAVRSALASLSAIGLLGFDLATRSYFHRVLPFDMERIAALNPRLKAAESLVAAGAVRLSGDTAEVQGEGVTHRVRKLDSEWSCTCPWFAKNNGQRGPCKHVLAVEIMVERQA